MTETPEEAAARIMAEAQAKVDRVLGTSDPVSPGYAVWLDDRPDDADILFARRRNQARRKAGELT